MGFRGRISRNTLAHANEKRHWRIFADFARVLIAQARPLYRDEPFAGELDETIYALDSTTIDLCLSLFPWAQFRRHKSAVKVHTLLDLRGSIPTNVYVTSGAVHDVRILDQLLPEAGLFICSTAAIWISGGSTCSNKVARSSSPAPNTIPNSGGATGVRCVAPAEYDPIRPFSSPDREPRSCIPIRCGASITSTPRKICV